MYNIKHCLLYRKQPAPVRINWASLNASREQVEAEKWAGKITDMYVSVQDPNTYCIIILISFTLSLCISEYRGPQKPAPCQNKCLHSNHCPQGGSEPGLNSVNKLYRPTSSLAICFSVLEDSGPSAETCFDTEQRACPQSAAFLSQRTHMTPSTYIYTLFVNGLVLANSVAVGKTPRQT